MKGEVTLPENEKIFSSESQETILVLQAARERSRKAMEAAMRRCEELELEIELVKKSEEQRCLKQLAEEQKLRYMNWICSGKNENINEQLLPYRSIYCDGYYRANYPEVARQYGESQEKLLKYFLEYGIKNGDQGCMEFNVEAYRKWNPNLVKKYGDDLTRYYHDYLNEGITKNRRAFGVPKVKENTIYEGIDYQAVYDPYDYLFYNKDLLKEYGLMLDKCLWHFVNFGMKEGRIAKKTFNFYSYKKRYIDLINLFGENCKEYYYHYIFYGKQEGRKGN